jgi:hypothetical protein
VTPDERLAEVVSALRVVGTSCLVMGGHAVRFYELSRYTNKKEGLRTNRPES